MTETLRLTIACLVALLALVVLAVGTMIVVAGQKLWKLADRVGGERTAHMRPKRSPHMARPI